MTKEDLVVILKDNLTVDARLERVAYRGPVLSVTLCFGDIEICSSEQWVNTDVLESDGEYY